MKDKIFFALMAITLVLGCSKKKDELKYTPEEFNHIMGTTSATEDKVATNALDFMDYSANASRLTSRPMTYERLSFAVIEFENEEQARSEAKRLNQYYSRNWLFDKVDGEPVLEDLVIIKYHAINPNKHTQRKAVNIPHESHGDPAGGGEHH